MPRLRQGLPCAASADHQPRPSALGDFQEGVRPLCVSALSAASSCRSAAAVGHLRPAGTGLLEKQPETDPFPTGSYPGSAPTTAQGPHTQLSPQPPDGAILEEALK